MKASRKDFLREIKHTKSRFISIFLIVALGVALFAGVRASMPDMKISGDRQYNRENLMDIKIIESTGVTEEIIDEIRKIDEITRIHGAYSKDVLIEEDEKEYGVKLMSIMPDINVPYVREGVMPSEENECLADYKMKDKGYELGDKIKLYSGTENPLSVELKNEEYIITGFATTSLYLNNGRGTSTVGNGKNEYFMMIEQDNFLSPVYSEVYVNIQGAREFDCYTDEYEEYIDGIVEKLEKEGRFVLTRDSIQAYVEYELDAERIGKVGEVFPLIFFIIAALICLTTMTRMVEEERGIIGTLKALGYSNFNVTKRFMLYALLATALGSVVGGFFGCRFFPWVIINAYKIVYKDLYVIKTPLNMEYIITATLAAVLVVGIATFLACYKECLSSPAKLMRPKAPKKGKRVLLERIPFIWKHLSFSNKSTVRNLLRYKKRLFMTIFGISGCMGLLLVGFGLKDSINIIDENQFKQLTVYDFDITMNVATGEESIKNGLSYLDNQEYIDEYLQMMENGIKASDLDEEISKEASIRVPKDMKMFEKFFNLRDRQTKKTYKLGDEEVIINEKLAKLLEVSVGDTIVLKIGETNKVKVKISDICENYLMHYVYMSPELYKKVYKEEPVYNKVYGRFNKDVQMDRDDFVKDTLNNNSFSGVTFVDDTMEGITNMIDSLDMVVIVLIVSAGGLAFLVLYNLNNISIEERKKELATLKVLGFYDTEVSAYVLRENAIITLIGIGVGVLVGRVMHTFVISTCEIDMVMFGRYVSNKSMVYCCLITAFFAILINGYMHFGMKKIDMASSMKSVD
ncbi:MAG: ABC transporter permease [Lachnospiraceae bacterium]|nr:ABC transporter permease [Lachnospiraceae bacterium]